MHYTHSCIMNVAELSFFFFFMDIHISFLAIKEPEIIFVDDDIRQEL